LGEDTKTLKEYKNINSGVYTYAIEADRIFL